MSKIDSAIFDNDYLKRCPQMRAVAEANGHKSGKADKADKAKPKSAGRAKKKK